MRKGLAATILVSVSLLPGVALAQHVGDGPRFGDEGELVIQDDARLQVGGTTQNGQNNGAVILLMPAADYFVVHAVSLGAQLLYANAGGGQSVGVAPRVGFNITITNDVSFWIKGTVGYRHDWDNNGNHQDAMFIEGFAPLLWHPASHFFLGIGPYVAPNFVFNNPTYVNFGLQTTVGGWFIP
jgi:hypothetical protein